ncbi:hypothetical protein CMI37_04215 [Candidatus Pacearchaeota archaeon]|nr:hypothetical protein [Candidatus Pacearchaeota archaeon]|tara:strand:- start:231 stop:917 length:687 start_codon:yes stop_codon:yes gene_type:complete
MGTLTLSEFRDEVKSNLGERDDVSDARLNRNINLAQTACARKAKFEELNRIGTFTLTPTSVPADDKFLDFGTDVRELYSVRITTDGKERKLVRISQRLFDKLYPDPTIRTGTPEQYILWNNIIEFMPVPDAVIVLESRWCIWPAVLSSDTATSDLDQKDDILIAWATGRIMSQLGNIEGARFQYAIFNRWFKDAKLEEVEKPDMTRVSETQTTSMDSQPHLNPFNKTG